MAACLALGLLDTGMLFYIFLFAVSQTVSRQRAWANSFALWLAMEVLVVSSVVVFFMHVLVPLMAMRDVRKIKQHLLVSLRDYQLSVEQSNQKMIAEDKTRSEEHESKTSRESSASFSFNAAQFLFLSHKIAQLFPELKIARIVVQFSTPWPKQSYQHTTDISQNYTSTFKAINKSASTTLMFFLTSFFSVPASVEDIVLQISTTTVVGYIIYVHVQLYEIYPVLVVVPVLVLVAMIHFTVKSSHRISPTLALDDKDDQLHRSALPVLHAENVAQIDHNICQDMEPRVFPSTCPPRSTQEQLTHVTRRASVAQGVVTAMLAEEALHSEKSNSVVSVEIDEDSLFSISEASDESKEEDDDPESEATWENRLHEDVSDPSDYENE